MIATTHPVSPEDVMALADGELSGAEAAAVSAHVAQCAECASLAARLRSTSESLSRWAVPDVPASLEEAVRSAAAQALSCAIGTKSSPSTGLGISKWSLWSSGGGRAIAVVAILMVVSSTIWVLSDKPYRRQRLLNYVAPAASEPAGQALPAPPPAAPAAYEGLAAQNDRIAAPASGATAASYANSPSRAGLAAVAGSAGRLEARTSVPARPTALAPVPMIAHSVSLTVQVGDLAAARAALEALLARHHGYAAQLTVNTAENSPRSLQSSLRVPDSELTAAIAGIRALGRVETETQSGEEVTQQHADLVARLQNSRETEERLRAILQQRTGRIEDVLQVEEEIARVRGEIEQMEADQNVLEHRVDFATIELQLTEQYREQLGPQSASVPMQIRNAFVAGLSHGENTLLGILLFLEEVGPTVLIWLAILAVPGFLMWLRYRRMLQRQ